MGGAKTKPSRLEEFLAHPRKGLWMLTIPMMVGMSVQTVYMLVDMIFVGMVSPNALIALAFNMPILFFGAGIVFGLGTGVTAVIAQYIGAEDKVNADRSAEHAVALGAVVSVVLTGGALLGGKELLAVLGVTPELMDPTWAYFRVFAGGFVFMVASVFFRSILAGEGDMKTPMMISAAATLLNIALDPIFIFTLKLGVAGAAWASVTAMALSALTYVVLLFFKQHAYITFDLAHFRWSGAILGGIFKIGVPSSFAFLAMAIGGGVFNRILTSYSGAAVAAFQVGARLDHIFVVPALSIAAALVTLVGMFYGARRNDLMREIIYYAIGRAVLLGLVVGAAFFVFSHQLTAMFSDDPEIRKMGAEYLRITAFGYPFVGVSMLAGRALQGMGFGAPVFVLATLRVLLISAPLAGIFVYWLGKPVGWVWVSMVIGVICASVVGFFWLQSGLRRADAGPAGEPAVGAVA